ncbi:MAG: hypothetical protein HXS52_09595 [Theionarchaea archaeon]|nr:hypothetical protein [Theionarchaea archaeon]MBU7038176.1 hypothetical protein [Theionarchaea archaeon]
MEIQSVIDTIVDALTGFYEFIVAHPLYIAIIVIAVIVYAAVSHLFFRMKGYQPREKTLCTLSIAGKERSLEYLRDFTHMSPQQIEAIEHLREHEPVPIAAMAKRFGKDSIEELVRREYIILK